MKKTIFPVAVITGAGGFIGANLVRRLLNEKYSVHVLWKKTTNPWRLKRIISNLTLHDVQLSDRTGLTHLFEQVKPDVIIHLAAHGAYSSQTDVDQMVNVNIQGLLNLLVASRDTDYRAFINTGSSSEYGFKDKPMKETDPLEPVSFYAATKASATYLCGVFAKEYKKPIVTMRPFSVYGPYEEPTRFVPTIINALIRQTPIKLTPGDQRRDFIYIDDLVDAYLAAMQNAKHIAGHVLNIGTGKEYTNDEVVAALFDVTGKKTSIQKGAFPSRLWDTSHWVADISRAKGFLRWRPQYTLASGLKKTYEWFIQHHSDGAGFSAHKHLYDIK